MVNLLKKIVINVIYLFLAALGLHSCMPAFSSCVKRDCCPTGIRPVLRASLQWVFLLPGARALEAHRLSSCGTWQCPKHVESSWTRGQNPCPLHWQEDSSLWATREVKFGNLQNDFEWRPCLHGVCSEGSECGPQLMI